MSTTSDVLWLASHAGMFCNNTYEPKSDMARERMNRLQESGYVRRNVNHPHLYGITQAGADAISRAEMEERS